MNDLSPRRDTVDMRAIGYHTNIPTLRIGIMGYYGFGNLGDEILLNAIRRFLMPHRAIVCPLQFSPTTDALERLNSFDYLIFGGGGLFDSAPIPPFNTFEQWSHLLQTPISVLGLGVKRLDSNYIKSAHCLVEQADFFIVRDIDSKRIIGHPQVQVAPDLTFYQPVQRTQSERTAQDISCGVNLRPFHRGVGEWIDAMNALPCHKQALPFSVVPTFDDREPLAQIVLSMPGQASMQDFQRLDVVIGTAFHSVVFAIQAGIPVIAINYHPKVRRLMEEVGLADFVLEWDEPYRLLPYFEKVLTEREAVRERMVAYTDRAQVVLTSILSEVRSTIKVRATAVETHNTDASANRQVTVLVLCLNASQADIAKTVTSCRDQTHLQVEIVMVDCPNILDDAEALPTGPNTLRHVSFANSDQDVDRLFAAGGDYITWISAGAWFAEDAIALLVKSLDRQPAAAYVYCDYFTTCNGNIERQIALSPQSLRGHLPFSFGVLVRRANASQLWHKTGNADLRTNRPAVHLEHPLFYRPVTESERFIFRAACAYGRSRTKTAQELLIQAIESNPSLVQNNLEFEQGFQAFLEAGSTQTVAPDPVSYLGGVCQALPRSNSTQRKFARRFMGRASLELAFMYEVRGQQSKASRSLLRAFKHDLRLLSNRGAMWLLVETIIGQTGAERMRRMRLRIRNML